MVKYMMRIDTTNAERFLKREWIEEEIRLREPTLKQVQQGEERYRESLGWLDTRKWASEAHLESFLSIARRMREDAQVVVLIGVGGSNNAARAVIEALQRGNGPKIVYAGTSTSAYTICRTLEKCENKSVYIINIAKNFETLEPGVAFRVFRDYLEKRYGDGHHKRVVVLGTIGSSLEKLCEENGYCFVPFATDIGGRFTAVSSVGLVPMAAAGIDVEDLVRGAVDMQHRMMTEPACEHMALRYAVVRNLLYRQGFRIEMLSSFEPQLRWFYKWWIQLFAESEGKDGKGLFPAASEYSEDLHSVGQYVQDGSPNMIETFLKVENVDDSYVIPDSRIRDDFDYLTGMDFAEVNRAAYAATLEAHSRQLPCMEVVIDRLDAYHFGQLFYFFAFACYLSGSILGINPFDQPGVEAYKKLMFRALGK